MASKTHEDFDRAHQFAGPSDRNFGTVFTLFFTLIGLWPLRHHQPIRMWALPVAAAFLVLTLARPQVLHPLNRAWLGLGLLLGRIVNPIVIGILFFVVFTPAGLIARALGKDFLKLKRSNDASYWVPRTPPGPAPETMAKQF
jgi:Saxitoxin biosynthesis operon protein SxtJ